MKKIGAVLVVGGGISGMQSSLDLADSGFKVYLLDELPTIGGVMAQLDKTFPTNDCSMCIMAPKLVATGKDPNIELVTNSMISGIEGEAGDFTVHVSKKARFVSEDKCVGCGLCAQWCPVEAINEFNAGLDQQTVVSVRYPQAVPLVYAIDRDKCIGCGLCERLCARKAIDYKQGDEARDLSVGSIILSPGFKAFDPSNLKNLGYGIYPNVVTSLDMPFVCS